MVVLVNLFVLLVEVCGVEVVDGFLDSDSFRRCSVMLFFGFG